MPDWAVSVLSVVIVGLVNVSAIAYSYGKMVQKLHDAKRRIETNEKTIDRMHPRQRARVESE